MDLYTLIYSLDGCYTLLFYTLLYTNILIYFCRPLYTLLYYTAPHILHHSYMPIIYSLSYIPIIIYSFIYSLLSLLFSNGIINLAPAVLPLSLIYLPLLFSHLSLYSHIVILTLLYRKGITTLPPIFTRFTSLS